MSGEFCIVSLVLTKIRRSPVFVTDPGQKLKCAGKHYCHSATLEEAQKKVLAWLETKYADKFDPAFFRRAHWSKCGQGLFSGGPALVLSADVDHGTRSWDEIRLADVVALLFFLDYFADKTD